MDKKLYFISYILRKRDTDDPDLISQIYEMGDNFIPILILFNIYSFFGYIAWDYIDEVIEGEAILEDFDFKEDLQLYKLSKKDRNLVQKLYTQEIIAMSLFYENYLLFDLPLTIENLEFFKKGSNPKIYRYKSDVQIGENIYDVRDIFESGEKEKIKFIENEYRLEKILFS